MIPITYIRRAAAFVALLAGSAVVSPATSQSAPSEFDISSAGYYRDTVIRTLFSEAAMNCGFAKAYDKPGFTASNTKCSETTDSTNQKVFTCSAHFVCTGRPRDRQYETTAVMQF